MEARDLFSWGVTWGGKDTEAMKSLLQRVRGKAPIIVEIGSHKGCSASIIGEYIKERKGYLFCVDPWPEADILLTFMLNMKALHLQDYIHPLVMESKLASTIFKDEMLEMVFIDGNHYYKSVMEDIKLWYTKIKHLGIMCGHDCDKPFHELPEKERERTRDFLLNIDGGGYATKDHGVLTISMHAGVSMAVEDSFGTEGYEVWENSESKRSRIWYHQVKHG